MCARMCRGVCRGVSIWVEGGWEGVKVCADIEAVHCDREPDSL